MRPPRFLRQVLARSRERLAVRYAAAAALACASVAVMVAASHPSGGMQFYFVALAAIGASALFGGWGPGLVAALLCAIGFDHFLYPPAGFGLVAPDLRLTLTYTVVALLAIWGGAALRETYDELERERRAANEAAERERAERARAEQSEALLDAVLEQMPVGVAIAEASSGRIVRANRQVAAMWRHEPAPGTSQYEAYRAFHADGRPFERWDWPLARALSTGARIENEEIPFVRRDGSRGTMLAGAAPVRDRDGRIVAAVANSFDITDRKRSETAQELLSEASRVLAESLDFETTVQTVARLAVPAVADWCAAVVLVGGEPKRVAIEAARPEDAALARRMRQSYPFDLQAATGIGRVLRTGEPLLVPEVGNDFLEAGTASPEARAMLEEMGLRSYLAVPMRAHGAVIGAMAFGFTDRSDRRFVESDLRVADMLARRCALAIENARLYGEAQLAARQREEVLAVVSHDLRNLLSTVVMSAAMLERGLPGDPEVPGPKRRAVMIRQASERMNRLIQDLADLASIEAGRLALERRPQDPGRMIEEAVETYRPMAHDRGVRLECRVESDVPLADCDRDRALQVLGNLVSNAVRATGPGGSVMVSARRGGTPWVLFSVEDTGRGIPEDELGHLFDRWRRGRSPGYRGSGLGLAISRGLVEAHGGRIWARSRPGAGTTFRFLLPVAPGAPRAEAAPQACADRSA